MGRGRRWPAEIVAEILSAADGPGARMTTLVYRSNSNFSRTKKYVDTLLAKGFLEKAGPNQRLYRTTPKGTRAMHTMTEVVEMVAQSSGRRVEDGGEAQKTRQKTDVL